MNLSKSLPSQQVGASVTNIALIIIMVVILAKLGMSIVPAQVGDYQLTKSLAVKLKEANTNKTTASDFLKIAQRQIEINGDQTTQVSDMITFKSKTAGHLSIHKKYEVESNFAGNIFIVNRFEGDIDPAESN